MGYFFRKSANFGPFRLNFSKSGIGASVGIKGARLTTSARGTTYVTVGRHGFYYRETLGNNRTQRPTVQPSERRDGAVNELGTIPTASAANLVDSTSANLLNQLNQRARMFNPATLLYFAAGATVLIAMAASNPLFLIAAASALVTGCVVHRRFDQKRLTRLFYELNDVEQSKFALVQQALVHLSQSQRIWRVEAKSATADWKRNAGAAHLIRRTTAAAGVMTIPHVLTNIAVSGVHLGSVRLFFLPDVILFYEHGSFGSIAYSDLRIDQSSTTFIEEEGVTSDTAVVSTTWRYVNKSGGPDRRFNNNRQLPVVRYGALVLTSPSGLNIHLNVSNLEKSLAFANCWCELQRRLTPLRARAPEPIRPRKSGDASAYKVLGIDLTATQAEIAAAYRRLAQMYHPDKVAALAPEFQAIAEERMKEINAAYESLKSGG